jgi:NitT/TauT family transport system ATP-binding protein
VDARPRARRQGAALTARPATASAAPTVVELDGAGKTFATGTEALAPVDLAIRAGEFVTLLGPSGCGKTTLLNLVAGLLLPTRGSIRWRDGDPGGRGRRMGYVFQSPTLMPWTRIDANVRLPLDLAGIAPDESQALVDDALSLVGLQAFARHFPRELSGGMQMRTSIARALVNRPDMLLMDEPFGALDEFSRHRLDAELLALWRERALTVLFVTHSIAEAAFLSTRVLVMGASPGRVVDDVPNGAPHPRDADYRTSPEFLARCRRLSQAVQDAAQAALDARR